MLTHESDDRPRRRPLPRHQGGGRTDRSSVRDVVDEALEAWLEASETREDLASAEEALVEYRRDGGEAAETFFGSLAAETRSAYGSDEA